MESKDYKDGFAAGCEAMREACIDLCEKGFKACLNHHSCHHLQVGFMKQIQSDSAAWLQRHDAVVRLEEAKWWEGIAGGDHDSNHCDAGCNYCQHLVALTKEAELANSLKEWDSWADEQVIEFHLKLEDAIKNHNKHVQHWLTEMYQTIVDPVDEFKGNIGDLCTLLLKRATDDRESIAAAQFRITQLEAVVKAAHELIQSFLDIMCNSNGVAGWHRNGDVATWDEFGLDAEIQSYEADKSAALQAGEGGEG